MRDDFFAQYLAYTDATESPTFFHRWSAIAGIGAILGRQYSFIHGHSQINTNIYCMLMGSPGTRKSSAIKIMKSLMIQAGYQTIAASKTTKEKFMMDLAGDTGEYDYKGKDKRTSQEILEEQIFGLMEEKDKPDAECFIMADEFNDFFGNGNVEFISLLGNLWDYSGVFENKIKNGKSNLINNPTISILGGNTPTGFSLAFPPEIIGQGFFSRILLIHGEPSGKRIAFPPTPDPEDTQKLVDSLIQIKQKVSGIAIISPIGYKLLDKIYNTPYTLEDVRFESYFTRRFTHLLKLCLIVSAARYSNTISEDDIVYANTILTHTEYLMPKALGEFGKSRNSDIAHKIMQVLENSRVPLPLDDLWKLVHQDLDSMKYLGDLVLGLVQAGKIIHTKAGFLAKKKIHEQLVNGIVNYEMLIQSEKGVAA